VHYVEHKPHINKLPANPTRVDDAIYPHQQQHLWDYRQRKHSLLTNKRVCNPREISAGMPALGRNPGAVNRNNTKHDGSRPL